MKNKLKKGERDKINAICKQVRDWLKRKIIGWEVNISVGHDEILIEVKDEWRGKL